MSDPLVTPLCELFGVRYPIIQTGMGWVAGARLTSATSAAGGLGILAAATMTHQQLGAAIREVKERTDEPFGVNLRGDQPDIERYVSLLLDEGVKVASFASPPGKDLIARLRDGGVRTMPTIGAPRHAVKMEGWGVDAVIAQGHEGGGHTGPVPTTLLLPSACAAVKIPVVGAGGFSTGQGLVAALAYGAAGIAMGTRFLLTKESTVPDAVKQQYLATQLTGTVVTTAIDGAPQRVIATDVIQRLEQGGSIARFARAMVNALRFRAITGTSLVDLLREGLAMRKSRELSWAQLTMAANAPMLTKATMVDGRLETGILPTGQVVGRIEELPTVAEVVESIMAEARQTLTRLGVPASAAADGGAPSGADVGADVSPPAVDR